MHRRPEDTVIWYRLTAASVGSSFSWQHQPQQHVNKEDLWKKAFLVDIPDHPDVTIQWFELKEKFVVHARVISVSKTTTGTFEHERSQHQSPSKISVGKVVQIMVDETWKRAVKAILEKRKHFPNDAFPPAPQLLQWGSVWLLDEYGFCQGRRAHARRLHLEDNNRCPDWTNYMLRIHTWPERHYAADWVDWGKFCNRLWLKSEISITVAGVVSHILIDSEGALPDAKDGAIVYEGVD